jgi:hypothetical protein
MTPSQIAARLGRLARGKPKRFSKAELKRRTQRLLAGAAAHRAKLAKAKRKART